MTSLLWFTDDVIAIHWWHHCYSLMTSLLWFIDDIIAMIHWWHHCYDSLMTSLLWFIDDIIAILSPHQQTILKNADVLTRNTLVNFEEIFPSRLKCCNFQTHLLALRKNPKQRFAQSAFIFMSRNMSRYAQSAFIFMSCNMSRSHLYRWTCWEGFPETSQTCLPRRWHHSVHPESPFVSAPATVKSKDSIGQKSKLTKKQIWHVSFQVQFSISLLSQNLNKHFSDTSILEERFDTNSDTEQKCSLKQTVWNSMHFYLTVANTSALLAM